MTPGPVGDPMPPVTLNPAPETNLCVILAVLALAAILVGAATVPPLVRAVSDFRMSCSVRFVGTGLNFGFEGWRAGAICREVTESSSNFSEEARSGVVFCQVRYRGLTETIRDSRYAPIGGPLVCAEIARHLRSISGSSAGAVSRRF